MQLDAGTVRVGDLSRLPGRHRHIALVPQWDLLDLLADAAETEPTFTLRRNAEVTGLLREGGRVVGARFTDRTDGSVHEIRATLTVACDGRGSAVRAAAGLAPRAFGVPMDVWWFRLPRHADDPAGGVGRIATGQFMVMIDRGDYWQCGYLIRKGSDAVLRAEGIAGFRARLTALQPWIADRVDELASFDDVKLLDVRLERLRRWYADGLLLIGDAAHAMSPVGGRGDQPRGAGRRRGGPDPGPGAARRQPGAGGGAAAGAAAAVVADGADPGRAAAGAPADPAARSARRRSSAGARSRRPRAGPSGSTTPAGRRPPRRCRSPCGCCAGSRCCRGSRPG